MSDLTETEILDRHRQALGEARDACQELGRNADPDYVNLRGPTYKKLRAAIQLLEGSARQLAHFRGDTRWLRLGIHYAKVLRVIQAKHVAMDWNAFNKLRPMFVDGLKRMEDLQTRKTGTTGLILPNHAASWLVMPDHRPAMRPRGPRLVM